MSKSYVLKALKILRLEEILKLTTAVKSKSALFKKAAGQELVSWDDASEVEAPVKQDAVVLPFVKPSENSSNLKSSESSAQALEVGHDQDLAIVSADFILWQRELSKDANSPLQNKQAVKGYAKSTDMYEVKTLGSEGKDKIRFASTQGVLINKKQA